MKSIPVRKAVYRFKQIPPDVAEAKSRAILRILAESLKEQRRAAAAMNHEDMAHESLYQTTEV